MCRANPATENCCISVEEIGVVPKQALHHDDRSTASTAASSDSGDWDIRCPVTGRLSDITMDYVVFPAVIGKGHYGTVRECISRATRETYAVKTIEKARIGRIDHLRREVELLGAVKHDSIMRMVDCYEDANYVHIVTDKYMGGELFDRIIENTTSSGCFSERRAATVIKSLLEAVAYLHENGIVHRDIKPENVLFESKEEDAPVRLIDFGLSRRHSATDRPMTNPVGTAYYMSPELLKGKYGASTDIWSVGVVAYIMLCGYPPFNAGTDPEIFDAIRRGHFDFPSQGWAGKSPEARDFIRCLLRRDPRKRLTAKDALAHPWITAMTTARPPNARRSSFSLKNLRRAAVRPL
jgi:serine/threonine protein kinase